MSATPEELQRARTLLEAAGYTVVPPRCEHCGGRGEVTTCGAGCLRTRPCPRGCRPPQSYGGTPNGAIVEATRRR